MENLNYKLLMCLLIGMFMISFVSAIEIKDLDNVKYYDEEKKQYTLKNTFGIPFISDTTAIITLDSPLNVVVEAGYRSVANFTITNGYQDYENIIKEIEIYDIESDMSPMNKKIDIKYITYEEADDYQNICTEQTLTNGTTIYYDCKDVIVGKKQKEVWNDFTKNSLLADEVVKIGLWTEVKNGEYVEWIPNVYENERLTKWASWNTSYNNQPQPDFTSGAVTNATGEVIQVSTPMQLVSVSQNTALVNATKCHLGTTFGGTEIGTFDFSGAVCIINQPLTAGVNYSITTDNGGASYNFAVKTSGGTKPTTSADGVLTWVTSLDPNGFFPIPDRSYAIDSLILDNVTTEPIVTLNSPANNSILTYSDVLFNASAVIGVGGIDFTNASVYANTTINGTSIGWWDTSWSDRKEINITNAGTTTLTNFPAYIDVVNEIGMQTDYDDLRFINGSCESGDTLELDYEIENYTASGADVWVKIPNIPTTQAQICMYYNNSGASSGENKTGVWDEDFSGIWHLSETDIDGGAGDIKDSTNNNNDGTTQGSMTSANQVSGIVDGNLNFDGSDDKVNMSVSTSLNIRTNLTLEAWINASAFGAWNAITGTDKYALYIEDGDVCAYIQTDGGAYDACPSANTLTAESWYYVVLNYNGGTITTYLDGGQDGTTSLGTIIDDSSADDYSIANYNGGNLWQGLIDEIRVSNTTRSPDWINMTYQNIQNYGSYVNVGIEESYSTTIPISGFVAINTTTGLSGNTRTDTWLTTLSDGNYIWNVQYCNDVGTCAFAPQNRTLSIDSTEPSIFVPAPNGTLFYTPIGSLETLNTTFTDNSLDSCLYNYNGTNISIDGCVSGIANITYFTLEADNYNMTVYANDTAGNENSQLVTWNYAIQKYNLTYNESITEGGTNTISVDLILANGGSSLTEAILNYNGTNYTTNIIFSGGEYTISSSIIAPTVTEDTNYSFGFFVVIDGVTYFPQSNNQTVLNLDFSVCGVLSNDTLMNMSLVKEIDSSALVGDIQISTDIISKTSGEIVETINESFDDVTSASICLSPVSSYPLFLLDSEIRYVSDGYAAEFYIIQKADLADYPQNLSLYDLNLNSSTEFLIRYQDDSLVTVEGAVIQLLRKYISEDAFKIVEAPLTSNLGTAVVHVDLNTNLYQAIVVKDGEVLDVFTNIVFNCENELSGQCSHDLFGSIDPQNSVSVEQLNDFFYMVSTANNTITTTFSVPSGTPSSINIALRQLDMFGNESLCNQTVVSSAGSIDCDYNDTIGDSMVYLEINKDAEQQAYQSYRIVEAGSIDWLGNNYVIIFILLLSIVGMALSSPEWIVINGIVVLLFAGGVWLANGLNFVVGFGEVIWIIVAGIILVFKLAKQEDR